MPAHDMPAHDSAPVEPNPAPAPRRRGRARRSGKSRHETRTRGVTGAPGLDPAGDDTPWPGPEGSGRPESRPAPEAWQDDAAGDIDAIDAGPAAHPAGEYPVDTTGPDDQGLGDRARRRDLARPGAERRPRRAARPVVAWAAVTAALLGGVGAGVLTGDGLATEVHLMVDGEPITTRTFADDVKGALTAAGVRFDGEDHVSPAPATPVRDSMNIVVRHSRRLTLIKDGRRYVREVTALNVADALKELDIDGARAKLSASLMRQIPVSGFKLSMRTERRVVIVTGDGRRRVTTTAGTVRDVLAGSGITPAKGEYVHPALDSFPKDGQVISVSPAHTVPVQDSVAALDWKGLAGCETRSDPRAATPPTYGMYHIGLPMWQAVGGAGKPSDWPAAEQTYRAQLLYQRVAGRWQQQWPTCGPRLFGR
jgi:hypothetical protein